MTDFNGFLFIGDPHVSSVRPGKRTDDFTASVLGKLAQAAKIAWEQKLVPVILGDLIHRDNENSIGLVSRLAAVLKQFPCVPLNVHGNHGRHSMQEAVPEDIEFLLATTGVLELMDDQAVVRSFEFNGQAVRLHVTPYGEELPQEMPLEEGVLRVLVTHKDLGFEGCYPGADPLREIPGCDMAVNGHMHKTSPSVVKGCTTWHCPGNIEPLSVDVRFHKPAVWEWRPESGKKLTPHYLKHNQDCFNLVEKLVAPATGAAAIEDLHAELGIPLGEGPEATQAAGSAEGLASDESTAPALAESLFAKLLAAEPLEAEHKTDEAAFLAEDLGAVMTELNASEVARALLTSLAEGVSRKSAQAAQGVAAK